MIYTLVQIELGLPSAFDALAALGALLSLSRGCRRWRALGLQPPGLA